MAKWRMPLTYLIPKNASCHAPERWIFFDTETFAIDEGMGVTHHKLKLGQALYWQRARDKKPEVLEWRQFKRPADFWEWVNDHREKKTTLHLVAHNLKFDFPVVDGFGMMSLLGYKVTSVYSKLNVCVIKAGKGTSRLVVMDSMNYFPCKLENLGKMVGVPKLAVDFATVKDDELAIYCRRDVEIIYKAIRFLIDHLESNDLGSLRLTAAATAMSVFRHKFYPVPITTHHRGHVVALERKAYTGGLVAPMQLYSPPRDRITKLDVNSMYPYVMRENPYPLEYVGMSDRINFDNLGTAKGPNCFVADVTVNTAEPVFPCVFPKRTIYPTGNFRTTVCTQLWVYGIYKGYIKQLHTASLYRAGYPFRSYVDYWYPVKQQARAEGNTALEMLAKLMLNSLYGKFGQMGTRCERIGDAPPDKYETFIACDADTGEIYRELWVGGDMLRIWHGGETICSFPAIAAHVTEYGRLYLNSLIKQAGIENCFYADTDSIFVNDAGRDRLADKIDPDRLGYLKVEEESYGFTCYAKKDYVTEHTTKRKGFTLSHYIDSQAMEEQIQSVGLFGAARLGIHDAAIWRTIKKVHSPYLTGSNVDTAGAVHPLHLPRDAGLVDKRTYTKEVIELLIQERG